ncbi:hypothetical protein GCM10010168_52990 [Actinoplanes ianthinogenes]|uniref:Uncharacterized protein n=1 Tax=Actinoplanes ianthinogenes TaxID=122358 RepID=A0ABM7LR23_9ACTN|nr:hypothetical protein Aiant_23600 [Actinoplanes ianthinogenes]GGR28304.1 hypothetical protein GCM10010168_52990 [Actinoplanes ianthinogenes]
MRKSLGSRRTPRPPLAHSLPESKKKGNSVAQPLTRDHVTRTPYDFTDFEERDERDAQVTDLVRAAVYEVPTRPGTRR